MTGSERWKKNRDYAMGKGNLEKFKEYLMPENKLQSHLQPNDTRDQFVLVEKYCRGLGLDWGCGTNRFSPTVLTTDWYNHSDTDLQWNVVHNGGRYPFPFNDERFDFVFASHVIEDFAPDELQFVFDEGLRLIKKGGYFVILVPDIEGGRYPKWDEVFTEEDEEVKSGQRIVGHLKGNPSHRTNFGLTWLHKLKNESKYQTEIVQEDTFDKNRMTLDFVLRKL